MFDYDMNSTINLMHKLSGSWPNFFRPPFGSYNVDAMNRWNDLKLLPIMWDVDSNDWRNPDKFDLAFQNIVNAFTDKKKGHIILCHDIHPTCLAHLNDIIDLFQGFNYTFVNISRCLGGAAPYRSSF
eukprot:NODE_56_length_28873_cov_1.243101.p19 type:complete len:127 gc:universal NODE_56_length_28873_cov_1.243101:2781-3161(+)